MTNNARSGAAALLISFISSNKSFSCLCRPAVSIKIMSRFEPSKCFSPLFTILEGSSLPSSPKTSTLDFSHIVRNWVKAPGLNVSAPITPTL